MLKDRRFTEYRFIMYSLVNVQFQLKRFYRSLCVNTVVESMCRYLVLGLHPLYVVHNTHPSVGASNGDHSAAMGKPEPPHLGTSCLPTFFRHPA